MVFVLHDPIFEKHRTGYHPECPERLSHSLRYLEAVPWFHQMPKGQLSSIAMQLLERTHTPMMIDKARQLAQAGGGPLDSDTFLSPQSFEVALHAAGSSMAAVDRVLTGADQRGFCLIRPPGHHATSENSTGFCVFNNIAIAAHYARDVHQLERVLIIDFDVHHGNGTQEIFYHDPSVFYLSIHRYPFYPGTGSAEESGSGRGLGSTLNIPLEFPCTRKAYLEHFHRALDRAVQASRPQLILISAGFDAHKDDPIGSLGLECEDYRMMTQSIGSAADAYCQGRIVSCLEGGYNVEQLPRLIETHLQGLGADLLGKKQVAGTK